MLILENVVLWAFLAALAYIFRQCDRQPPFEKHVSAQQETAHVAAMMRSSDLCARALNGGRLRGALSS